jgi:hypothetical protein
MFGLGSMIGLVLCLAVVLVAVGAIGVVTLIKAGVIVRHATKPTHQDYGTYTLSQGREVRPEEDPRA